MKTFIITVILSISAVALFSAYKYFKYEKNILKTEIEKLQREKLNLIKLKQKYKKLSIFIKENNLKPLKKSVAEEKFLKLVDTLKQKYKISIIEKKEFKDKVEFKVELIYPYKDKKEIKNLFDELLNKNNYYIASVDSFYYQTDKTGTTIGSIINIYIPFIK